jgi:predicted membrane channel-forming protein YqfA (hemolysin III family)
MPFSKLGRALGPFSSTLLVLGGVTYSVGGIAYAARWPDPFPKVNSLSALLAHLVHASSLLIASCCCHNVDQKCEYAQLSGSTASPYPPAVVVAMQIFGYHEIFHAMVILASALHFAAIYLLVQQKA